MVLRLSAVLKDMMPPLVQEKPLVQTPFWICFVRIKTHGSVSFVRIKTHGSVSCGPRGPGRVQTGVIILIGTTKLRFSHIHRSVTFYPKITKFAVELPTYKGRLDSQIEVNRARCFRDTRDQSFSFCSSFFFFFVFSHKSQNQLQLASAYSDPAEIWYTCRALRGKC